MKKKKLKVAIGPVFDEFGGVSRHIFNLQQYSLHDIDTIPSKFIRELIAKKRRRIKLYNYFMQNVSLTPYDIVHSHADPYFIERCYISQKSDCKWVHTYHTLYFEEDEPNGLAEWQKQVNKNLINLAPKADSKISISKWLHEYLLKNYSIETEIIPNGVDLKICDHADRNKFTEKYSIDNFILYVGYLNPIKNPVEFIELAKKLPEIPFVMIGRNLSLFEIKKVYKNILPENLILMGEMPHEDVLNAISACSVYVMTSKREGIPTTLLEAMGLEKPVVAPDHYGCKEVLDNGKYGYLYQPGSIEDLAENVYRGLESPLMIKKARERVEKHYDWKVIARKIDTIYERISCKS